MVTIDEIKTTEALAPDEYANVVRRTVFDCCKWDPQLEDISVLAPFALVLSPETWRLISDYAERLSAETLAMEAELVGRADLQAELGIPRSITRGIHAGTETAHSVARVMRFDFHLTTEGWQVSEVNCDVPGGFIEASGFTQIMAEHYPEFVPAGDPSRTLAECIAGSLPHDSTIALVHATAYTDDRQVMIFLSKEFQRSGMRCYLASPDQLRWTNGKASVIGQGDVDAILRFFPAEWLPNLGRRSQWPRFFTDSITPQCNPATALLVQSKRLPLVWNRLRAPSETWRELLPETRDPREAEWHSDPSWILKPALGRVGSGIGMAEVTSSEDWKPIRRSARWFPRNWIAQQRFEAVPVPTPSGMQFPCIGVYTVNGCACGIYGRIAQRSLIDHRARDIAVLIPKEL